MKNKKMLGIGIILFVVLIVGASILYNSMKDKVEDNSFQITGGANSDDKDTDADNQDTNTDSTDNQDTNANTDNADSDDADSTDKNADKKVAAPDFTMTDKDGNEVRFSNFAGKPIVLNFWASWCGPCQMEMPDFEEMYKEYGEEVAFVMVNMTDGAQETLQSATQFITDKGYTFPVYYDTKMEGAYLYSVYSLPMTYFVDADGNVAASSRGMISGENLQKGIEAIVK